MAIPVRAAAGAISAMMPKMMARMPRTSTSHHTPLAIDPSCDVSFSLMLVRLARSSGGRGNSCGTLCGVRLLGVADLGRRQLVTERCLLDEALAERDVGALAEDQAGDSVAVAVPEHPLGVFRFEVAADAEHQVSLTLAGELVVDEARSELPGRVRRSFDGAAGCADCRRARVATRGGHQGEGNLCGPGRAVCCFGGHVDAYETPGLAVQLLVGDEVGAARVSQRGAQFGRCRVGHVE